MAQDAEFQAILDNMLNNPDPTQRAKAARILGDYVDELQDDEYEEAKRALNQAMTDPDPRVLTTVMQTMAKYDRLGKLLDLHGDSEDDMLPEKASACNVCGRPEAVIPDGGCERDDCPYNAG
jgi:uncharacterized membrane-anchored protein YjiN (DUF445 family)